LPDRSAREGLPAGACYNLDKQLLDVVRTQRIANGVLFDETGRITANHQRA